MNTLSRKWWAHLDSNQGPTGYEPVALPAELWARASSAKIDDNSSFKGCQGSSALVAPPSAVHLLIVLPLIIKALAVRVLIPHGFHIRHRGICSLHLADL
jgi:hypothetical protein